MKFTKIVLSMLVITGALVALTPEAQAIPSFARKYNLNCSSCHVAMPYLNPTGRAFKEAGYRMPGADGQVDPTAQPNKKISDDLTLEKYYPIAGRVKGYLVDKTKGTDAAIRPTHEVALLAGGNYATSGSFLMEFEGEDKTGFAMVGEAGFGWHFSQRANVKVGIGPALHADPYNSLHDGGMRLTVSHKVPPMAGSDYNANFGAGSQYMTFYGRVNKAFYLAGFNGGGNNDEGQNPRDFVVRGAYDLTPDLMVGGLYYTGTRGTATKVAAGETQATHVGVDWNLGFGNLYADGMFLSSKSETATMSETNKSADAEFFYTLINKNNRPFFVPVVRYDWTEVNNGADSQSTLTAQGGFYVLENAKLALEYSAEVGTVGNAPKSNRLTVLADIAF